MATRITQDSRVIVADPTPVSAGGRTMVTQVSRAMVVNDTPFTLGGRAMVTQCSRVIIATIALGSDKGLPTMGVGA